MPAARSTDAVALDAIAERRGAIHDALGAGDIDDAYSTFTEWIRQEARYAQAERATNVNELIGTMLEMMGWMYERVPRTMVRSAAR